MADETIKEIVNYLKEEIIKIKEYNRSMNDASWGYEEGILFTGNEAQYIINHIKDNEGKKDDN